jgi:hypothetical protein
MPMVQLFCLENHTLETSTKIVVMPYALDYLLYISNNNLTQKNTCAKIYVYTI